jgi:hypothetical protein
MNDFYCPPDVDEQHELWGANCGPTALAALLGRPVAAVRSIVEQVQGGRFLGYMNATHLENAVRAAGLAAIRTNNGLRGRVIWPERRGLVVLQIDGPWCEMGVNPRARFRYTHTVASSHGGAMIYDGNADKWRRRENWEREVMAFLVQDQKRATGWYTSSVIEVSR